MFTFKNCIRTKLNRKKFDWNAKRKSVRVRKYIHISVLILCFVGVISVVFLLHSKKGNYNGGDESNIKNTEQDAEISKEKCSDGEGYRSKETESSVSDVEIYPPYAGYAYVEINNNMPYFTDEEKEQSETFESYSELDNLGRCGVAYANVCKELQPIEERGAIGDIKPSGWHTVKYNNIIDGNYLYNRCHLIGYQLTGENANINNLITGTRYLNVIGMLPFENRISDYIMNCDNHVLYRVTPVFEGENLVASGVLLEAWSVEDNGKGVSFNVYCYNVQPGIEINYFDGTSCENPDIISYDYDENYDWKER